MIPHIAPGLQTPNRPWRWKAALLILLPMAMGLSGCATTPSQSIPANSTSRVKELIQQSRRLPDDPARAIGLSLSTAEQALGLAVDRSASSAERTTAMHVYNAAVSDCVLALQKLKPPLDGGPRKFPGTKTTYELRIVSSGSAALKNPAAFTKLIAAGKIARKHLRSDIQRDGLGAPFVGVIKNPGQPLPNQAPGGFAEPLTAIAKFKGADQGDATAVDLLFYNPKARDTVTLENTTFQLRGDFTAPLAHYPPVRNMLFGIVAMLRSDKVVKRSGIFFMEPFDPDKIPVLFVHGLMSSPQAFVNFINELNRDPDFRRRYQGMVFFYPSGGPIAANAVRLRKDLAELAANYPLKRNIIVVGHSMGGILTRMQITNTNRQLWDSVFGSHAQAIYSMLPADSLLKKALIFRANPNISRVVFFSVPHRGSKLADLRISAIAGALIRKPAALMQSFTPQMRSIVQNIDPNLRSVPSSIIGLSPRSPLLKGMSALLITVPHHSVIGNRGLNEQPLAESTDGIVPYWSSHLEDAESELIVPTGHDSFDCYQSATELLRILKSGK